MFRGEEGFTLATIVVLGVVMIFVIPVFSHALLFAFGMMVSGMAETCSDLLQMTCTFEERKYTTPLGDIVVKVPRYPEVSVAARLAELSLDLLLSVLYVFTRIEVMAAAFAVDLVTAAYEEAEK